MFNGLSFDKDEASFDFTDDNNNRLSIKSDYDNPLTNKEKEEINEFISQKSKTLYLNNWDLSFTSKDNTCDIDSGGSRSGRQSYSVAFTMLDINIVYEGLKQYLKYSE
jgi:hypothetical protein